MSGRGAVQESHSNELYPRQKTGIHPRAFSWPRTVNPLDRPTTVLSKHSPHYSNISSIHRPLDNYNHGCCNCRVLWFYCRLLLDWTRLQFLPQYQHSDCPPRLQSGLHMSSIAIRIFQSTGIRRATISSTSLSTSFSTVQDPHVPRQKYQDPRSIQFHQAVNSNSGTFPGILMRRMPCPSNSNISGWLPEWPPVLASSIHRVPISSFSWLHPDTSTAGNLLPLFLALLPSPLPRHGILCYGATTITISCHDAYELSNLFLFPSQTRPIIMSIPKMIPYTLPLSP